MYTTVLFLHSWLRWIVLIAGVLVVARAWRGSRSGTPFGPNDRRAGLIFVSSMDLQFVLGLVMYLFFSPITAAAFENFGGAMKDGVLRFFAVEHTFLAVAALAMAHIGNARAKRAPNDKARFKQMALFFTISLVLLLIAIPWPGRSMGRALFRF